MHGHHFAGRHHRPKWRPVSPRQTSRSPRFPRASDGPQGLRRSHVSRLHQTMSGMGSRDPYDAQRCPQTRMASKEAAASATLGGEVSRRDRQPVGNADLNAKHHQQWHLENLQFQQRQNEYHCFYSFWRFGRSSRGCDLSGRQA